MYFLTISLPRTHSGAGKPRVNKTLPIILALARECVFHTAPTLSREEAVPLVMEKPLRRPCTPPPPKENRHPILLKTGGADGIVRLSKISKKTNINATQTIGTLT